MPRRAYGTGSIQRIRDDYWRIVAPAGIDPTTKKRRRIVRYVHGTKRQAEAELARLIADVTRGRIGVADGRMTVEDWLDRWLAERQRQWRPTTYARHRISVEVHLKRLLGHVRLQRLTPQDIQDAIVRMEQEGYAPKTIRNVMGTLRAALSTALERDLIPRDPMRGVRVPSPQRRVHVSLTEEQIVAICREARRYRYGLAVIVAARTGMRRGEVLGLRWQDIDWEARLCRIRNTLVPVDVKGQGRRLLLQPAPKTRAGERIVAVDMDLLALLRHHRREQARLRLRMGSAWQDHDLVFCRPNGAPVNPASVGHTVRAIGRRLGLDGLRLHDLRHAHATHLLAAGWPVAEVSARLGHSSPAITHDIYAHAVPGLQAQLLDGTKMAPLPLDDLPETKA